VAEGNVCRKRPVHLKKKKPTRPLRKSSATLIGVGERRRPRGKGTGNSGSGQSIKERGKTCPAFKGGGRTPVAKKKKKKSEIPTSTKVGFFNKEGAVAGFKGGPKMGRKDDTLREKKKNRKEEYIWPKGGPPTREMQTNWDSDRSLQKNHDSNKGGETGLKERKLRRRKKCADGERSQELTGKIKQGVQVNLTKGGRKSSSHTRLQSEEKERISCVADGDWKGSLKKQKKKKKKQEPEGKKTISKNVKTAEILSA